jgi:type I restriction enzyme, S subunit
VSNGLPAGWQVSCLDELASSVGGGTPSKSEPKFWSGGNVPWVSPKDMKSDLIYDSEDHVTEAALDRLSVVPADSILVVVRSGILSRTLPVAQTKVPVTVNQDMRAFVPEGEICASYLAWQLRAKEREILGACSKDGTTVASIEGPALARFPLAVAPAGEQTRIVAKLEELLSDLDAGVVELNAAQKKLQQYRQSLLKAAVEGALTADWREAQRQQGTPTGTGAQLLARILTERRARWEAEQLAKFKEQGKAPPKDWQKKYPEPTKLDASDLQALPEGWTWTVLGQCFQVVVGATPSRKEPSYWNGNIPWVSSGEVRFSRIGSTKETITEAGLDNSSTQINPPGSVLLGMIGEGKTRGQVAILNISAANNQNCAAIWVGETPVPSEFVYYWLWSRYDETRRGSSGNNQPALNKSIVEGIAIPLAPIAELKEIVRVTSSTLEQIDQQERVVELSLKQCEVQRQNLLRAAFKGQLAPQDPKDEPASALLERIRAARTERASRPRARKSKKYAEA